MYQQIKQHYERFKISISNYRLKKESKERIKKDFELWLIDLKKHYRYQNRKRTIKKNIKEKDLNIWATITFKQSKAISEVNKKTFQALRVLFKRYDINYILVPERHESGLYHLHGFLSIPHWHSSRKLFQPKTNDNNKPLFDKFGNQLYHFEPITKNYGFNHLIDLTYKNYRELRKIISYSVKYTLKSDNRMLSNRINSTALEIAKKMFGEQVRYIDLQN